jgi:uncharacterized protein YigE (DUF2233 family)
MKSIVAILAFIAAASTAGAQFVEKHNLPYKNASYDVVVITVDSTIANILALVENTNQLTEEGFFRSAITTPFMGITASVVDTACSPLGLYITDRKVNNAINRNKGSGNFFSMPNGFISVDTMGTVRIQSSELYTGQELKLAIQSGPMLLMDGTVNPAFDPRSQNRNIRCGAGMYTEQGRSFLVFIKSNTPVTFFELAGLFKEKYKCSNALNLESGEYCSMHLPTIPVTYRTKLVPCRYLVIKL